MSHNPTQNNLINRSSCFNRWKVYVNMAREALKISKHFFRRVCKNTKQTYFNAWRAQAREKRLIRSDVDRFHVQKEIDETTQRLLAVNEMTEMKMRERDTLQQEYDKLATLVDTRLKQLRDPARSRDALDAMIERCCGGIRTAADLMRSLFDIVIEDEESLGKTIDSRRLRLKEFHSSCTPGEALASLDITNVLDKASNCTSYSSGAGKNLLCWTNKVLKEVTDNDVRIPTMR